MINFNNLVQDASYPVTGFLKGENILPDWLYQEILKYDYSHCIATPSIPNRRANVFKTGKPHQGDQASKALQMLAEYLGQYEVLEGLIGQSFQGMNFGMNQIWHLGLDAIKERFREGVLILNEDTDGYKLGPHSDNRTIIANLQIFLEPDVADIGTRFHRSGNFEDSKKIPFVGNSGYFLINSDLGFHSAENQNGIVRRSIIFSWVI